MQCLDHLHPSVLKEWAQEMKDAAERIFNKSTNSKAEKNPSRVPGFIFKRRKSNQEYVRSMNLIKSQHATENNYSFLQNSKTKKKTNDHQRRYDMGSPELDCAKLTRHLSLIRQLIFTDKVSSGSLYGLFTLCCMGMDF